MSLSEATGAPAPITIGETVYTATPLNLYELGAVEETVRAIVLSAATRAAADLPKPLGDRLIDLALTKVVGITFFSDDTRKYMGTFAGVCQLVSLSLNPKYPAMTAQAVAKVLSDRPEQYDAAMMTVMRISGLLAKQGEADEKPGEAVGAAGA